MSTNYVNEGLWDPTDPDSWNKPQKDLQICEECSGDGYRYNPDYYVQIAEECPFCEGSGITQ